MDYEMNYDYEGGTNVRSQYSNYITKKLREMYRKKLIAPAAFLLLLIIIAIIHPVFQLLFPRNMSDNFSAADYYEDGTKYVDGQLNNLYFTGYTKSFLGKTLGYYYYTVINDSCYIVLIGPEASSQGISTIEALNSKYYIHKANESDTAMLRKLAGDLRWNEVGIKETVSCYVIDQVAATNTRTTVFKYLYLFTFVFTLAQLAEYGIILLFPVLSIPVQALRRYGSPQKLLAKAEEEIATLPQLATEDMFITEHFFIETSSYGVAIIPIDKIIWIYKYSTLHHFLWHHFSISYTLHITADNRFYIRCPKNTKSDIDGVMDYLAEANHDILVGFNEENRLKVKTMQNDFSFIKKVIELLKKRI